MKAGDLTHKITLLKPTWHKDSRGNRLVEWEEAYTVWASKADVSGRDFYQAQAYQAQDTVTFGIRYRDDVTQEWRINDHGEMYDILEVNHLSYKRDYMHLKAKRTKGEGS